MSTPVTSADLIFLLRRLFVRPPHDKTATLCVFLYFRLRRILKKKSWRLSACSMTMKQAGSPSRTWRGWPRSWGRTSQTKNCRYASTKSHALHLHCPHSTSTVFFVQEMIDEADRDGDGEVNQQEFLRIMKKTCLYWRRSGEDVFPVWCCLYIYFYFQMSILWTSYCIVPLFSFSFFLKVTSFFTMQSQWKINIRVAKNTTRDLVHNAAHLKPQILSVSAHTRWG